MKKSYIVGIIIIIAIIIGIYIYSLSEENLVRNVPCSSEYLEAINKTDVTICEFVTDLEAEYNCKDNCIKEIAYKKGEPKLCELINPDANYNLAEYNSLEELVPLKDFCYIHLVEKLGDVSLCEKVETDWAKSNCP